MHGPRTTICCSALALTLALSAALLAQGRVRAPLSLFPTHVVWTLDLNNQLIAPPANDEARVYFPIEGPRLAAYGIASGTLEWIVSSQVQMEPVTGDGLIFVVEPQTLTALKAATGAIAWQLPLTEKLAVRPVWDNGWLVAGTASGTVLAFRAQDGFLVWSRDLGSPAHGLLALAADRVYVPAADGRVVALRVDTGAVIWDRKLGGAPHDILALDDRVFVGGEDHYFYSLVTKDGRVDWRWRTGADVIGQPVADANDVYFASLDNALRALARRSGGQQWMRALPLRPASGPVLAAETLVVRGVAPGLRAYNAKDGTPAGEVPTMENVTAPPRAIGGLAASLLVTTSNILTGATATLVTRAIEPEVVPIAPLPNPVAVSMTDLQAEPPR